MRFLGRSVRGTRTYGSSDSYDSYEKIDDVNFVPVGFSDNFKAMPT